jgi:hypothetical protein
MDARAALIEELHKACGSVEVARDLLGRSGSLYVHATGATDEDVNECFAHAASALSRVVEALQLKMSESSLGPAA